MVASGSKYGHISASQGTQAQWFLDSGTTHHLSTEEADHVVECKLSSSLHGAEYFSRKWFFINR